MLSLAVFLPIAAGLLMLARPPKTRRARELAVEGVTVATSLLVLFCLLFLRETQQTLVHLTTNLPIAFHIDGVGSVFTGIVAFLWPLATLYGFEYMEHEGGENHFFAVYTITYGVTLGISMAANAITLYTFYEFLTLCTLPLVVHGSKKESRRAGRMYVMYSFFGAALAFIGVMIAVYFGGNQPFTMGGVLGEAFKAEHPVLLEQLYKAVGVTGLQEDKGLSLFAHQGDQVFGEIRPAELIVQELRFQRCYTGLREHLAHGICHTAAQQHGNQAGPGTCIGTPLLIIHQENSKHSQHKTAALQKIRNLPVKYHGDHQCHQQSQLLEYGRQHHAVFADIHLHQHEACQIQKAIDRAHGKGNPHLRTGKIKSTLKTAKHTGQQGTYNIIHGQHSQVMLYPMGTQPHYDGNQRTAEDRKTKKEHCISSIFSLF